VDSPLVESLTELTHFIVGRRSVLETLERIAHLSVEAIGPTDLAGVTLMFKGTPRTEVFTDPISPEIDQVQYDAGEGPCLEAMRDEQVLSIGDTRDFGPWTAFRSAAAGHGVRSTVSFPLVVADGAIGAMNLYARRAGAFNGPEIHDGLVFAKQAAVVVANACLFWGAQDLSERLGDALESRGSIEQAKGILMATQRCSPDEAFDLLRRASQRENTKLREIAERMVEGVQANEPRTP
jgi:GAF domain-containing protein